MTYIIRHIDGKEFEVYGADDNDNDILEWYANELDCNVEDFIIIEKY